MNTNKTNKLQYNPLQSKDFYKRSLKAAKLWFVTWLHGDGAYMDPKTNFVALASMVSGWVCAQQEFEHFTWRTLQNNGATFECGQMVSEFAYQVAQDAVTTTLPGFEYES